VNWAILGLHGASNNFPKFSWLSPLDASNS